MTSQLSTVQKRGQITIPSDLRAEFGIEPGDQVAFVRTQDGILITTTGESKGRPLAPPAGRDEVNLAGTARD